MADATLDAKGLNCPLPILKAKKALKDVPADGTLDTRPGCVASSLRGPATRPPPRLCAAVAPTRPDPKSKKSVCPSVLS